MAKVLPDNVSNDGAVMNKMHNYTSAGIIVVRNDSNKPEIFCTIKPDMGLNVLNIIYGWRDKTDKSAVETAFCVFAKETAGNIYWNCKGFPTISKALWVETDNRFLFTVPSTDMRYRQYDYDDKLCEKARREISYAFTWVPIDEALKIIQIHEAGIEVIIAGQKMRMPMSYFMIMLLKDPSIVKAIQDTK